MLNGKAMLITGGGAGIGRAAALAAVREGARVAIADIDEAAARDAADLARQNGGDAIGFAADVSRAEGAAHAVAKTVSAFGRLDAAFNNAGIAPHQAGSAAGKTADLSEEAFGRVIAVNLTGVWLCMKAEIAQLLAQSGGGAIVNTASVAGLVGLPLAAAYAASKHGVLGLTKTAAVEYAKDGVRVNAVCPGFVRTKMTAEGIQRAGAQILMMTPQRRIAEPEEIAELVVWLCSGRASFATGGAYAIDGGYTAL